MKKLPRILLVVVGIVACLLELAYVVPAFSKYLAEQPALPVMPTFAYQATPEPIKQVVQSPSITSAAITPIPGNLPTSTVTPTATTTQPASGNQPITAQQCNNVLYPVKPGQQWLYQVSARGLTTQIKMVVSAVNGKQASVNISNAANGVTSNAIVDCDNGVIRNFPLMGVGMLFGNLVNGTLNAQYVSGVFAPSETAFTNNNWGLSWSADYRLSGNSHIRYKNVDYNLTLNNSPAHLACQTLGTGNAAFQSITVRAGTYSRALKVICDVESQVTGTINGDIVSGTLNGRSSLWFSPNLGLLKMQVDSTNIRIFGVTIPVVTDSKIELNQFIPAP